MTKTLAAIPIGSRVMIDGLAMGALPEVVHEHRERLRILALLHHPLADETGLTADQQERLAVLEEATLAACRGVVVTSPFTASRLQAFGVARERVRAVCPGTDRVPPATGPGPKAPPRLLCVASVIPRKGQDILVGALARLRDLCWDCVCVGSLEAHPSFTEAVLRRVRDAGLRSRIDFVGECDARMLDEEYDRSSIFVLPSHYEGYGMALTEALARGLPVVSTSGGAIPQTLPDEAALLVPPGDEEALATALRALLSEPCRSRENGDPSGSDNRARLAAAARRHAASLPDWDQAARAFAKATLELASGGPREEASLLAVAPSAGAHLESFNAEWLALREPVDRRSRALDLLPALQAAWRDRGGARIVDLGSGTGSNLRYLAPKLVGAQRWTLVDHDSALLARTKAPRLHHQLLTVQGDLGVEGLEAAARADLVTGSALLDLVSEAWLRRLVAVCCRSSSVVYFTLNYDGQIRWAIDGDAGDGGFSSDDRADGEDPDDSLVRRAVNAHQRRDKGMGPALGPTASKVAEELLVAAGYRTWLRASGWRLTRADAELSRVLVEGWRRAASGERPEQARRIDAWAQRRRDTIEGDDFVLEVGHTDLLALPGQPSTDSRDHC